MKSLAKILLSTVLISTLGGAVTFAANPEPKWLDATHLFAKETKMLVENVKLETLRDFEIRTRGRAVTPVRERQVGDVESFWTKNIKADKFEQIQATLKVVGKHCYVYLQNGKTVPDSALTKVRDEFDSKIYPTNTEHFGFEWKPGIDNDERITLLLFDIQDGFDGQGGFVAGYFFAGDEFLQSQIPANIPVKSNEREMFYLDIHPGDPTKDGYMSVVAHEFQHMIHFNQDKREETWLNEACAQIAPFLCGFGHPGQIMSYMQTPDNSLTAWAEAQMLANYGQVYLWNYYLVQRFANSESARKTFFKQLVADQAVGVQSYQKALKRVGTDFAAAYTDFGITNFVNAPMLDKGQYAYDKSLGRLKLPPTAQHRTLPAQAQEKVFLWSTDAVTVDLTQAKSSLDIEFVGARAKMGTQYNSFVVAAILSDSRNAQRPTIQFMKIDPMNDKQGGKLEITGYTSKFDTLTLTISAQAPLDIPAAAYAKAPGIPYAYAIADKGVLVARLPGVSRPRGGVGDAIDRYVAAARSLEENRGHEAATMQALTTLEGVTAELLADVERERDSGQTATIDAFLVAAEQHPGRNQLRPLARKLATRLAIEKATERRTFERQLQQLEGY